MPIEHDKTLRILRIAAAQFIITLTLHKTHRPRSLSCPSLKYSRAQCGPVIVSSEAKLKEAHFFTRHDLSHCASSIRHNQLPFGRHRLVVVLRGGCCEFKAPWAPSWLFFLRLSHYHPCLCETRAQALDRLLCLRASLNWKER